MKKHAWGMSATLFGTWEAVAFSTRGRVPTVSTCVWYALGRKRAKHVMRFMIAAYLLGLGHHLMNGNDKPL